MKIIRFEDLDVWKEATSLAVDIYGISMDGKLSKDFGLLDQIRKSAVSIASNIAEGKERETVPEFIRFLYIAKGSAGELRTQIYIAQQIGYLEREKYDELKARAEKISGMLGNLIKTLKKGK
jgi:four helix bundle protein